MRALWIWTVLVAVGCADEARLTADNDGSSPADQGRPDGGDSETLDAGQPDVGDMSLPLDLAVPIDTMPRDVDASMPPDPPCGEGTEGMVLVAGELSTCTPLEGWPCDPRGEQTLEVVVCRTGTPTEEVQQVECTVESPGCEDGVPTRRVAGLPRIHDLSGASPEGVDRLVSRALDGLGLDDQTGPSEHDRVVVGRWYMAWIDETGFYGKMNGLWPLNGDVEALDFVVLDGLRPVNGLVVGEFGQGRWPGGYMGAEHVEFPNSVPEADDDPGCRETFCAQYSLGEAPLYTVPQLSGWRACNAGSPQWSDRFQPAAVGYEGSALTLVYEGPLTKQGDFGGSANGAHCHEDYLFPDGVRRPVYLRLGYRFDPTAHAIDRLFGVRNPEGNPVFDGPHGLIGGFVMTQWPTPHPAKQLNHFLRVEEEEVTFRWTDFELTVPPGPWFQLPHGAPDHDVVLGWAGQSVTLSPVDGELLGRAYTLSNHDGVNPDDTGFCLCRVHGGIEMGGGLLQEPIPGGTSPQATRRLTILHRQVLPPEGPWRWVYEAEAGGPLRHEVGRAQDDGWGADTGSDAAGHMVFGPYDRGWPAEPLVAEFRMMIDVVNDRDEIVANVDIFDADTQEVVASAPITRSAFDAPFAYQGFRLEFDNAGRAGHAMESRVWWPGISYVRVDRVVLTAR